MILKKLNYNKLYVNGEKNEFALQEIEFLEYEIVESEIKPDIKKVKVIEK